MKDFEHFGMDCRNQSSGLHTFRLPPPRRLGVIGESNVASERVFVLCPECKAVFSYTKQDVNRRLFRVPDEYLPHSPPICFVVEFLCGTLGCREPLRVYLLAYKGEDKRAVLGQFRDVAFHMTCHEGHAPHFDFANLIRVDLIGPSCPLVL